MITPLTEPEIGGVLSGFTDQNVAAGCYCSVKGYSNYGNFKMLVKLVLREPDDGGDSEVRSSPQRAFLVFWDLIPIYISRDTGTGVHGGGTASLAF